MPHHEKSIARLLQGAAFFGAILVSPCAFAHDYGNDSSGHHQAYAVARHHHSAMHLRRHHSNREETAYLNEHSLRRAQLVRANYEARVRNEARQARHEEFALNARERPLTAKLNVAEVRMGRERAAEIADAAEQRERSVTAELNLVQMREGQERAAAMAQWQLQYGATASTKG